MLTRVLVSVRLLVVGIVVLLGGTVWSQVDGAESSNARAVPEQRPNIVLVFVDDLGYGDLGCFGQTKIRTPNLDRMAAEGMRLSRHYSSAPVCAPTRAMLLTGMHSGHAVIRDNQEMRDAAGKVIEGQAPFPEGTQTLGTVMRGLGYTTGIIGKWGNGGPGSTGEPAKMGFDFSYGYLCQRQAHNFFPTHLWRNGVREPLEGNVPGNRTGPHYAQDLFIEETLRFVEQNKERPFFLWLTYTIPHVALQTTESDLAEYSGAFDETPYEGDKGYLKHPTPRAAYAAMITRLDKDVGRLLEAMKANGLDERTLVMFTSDNGPTHDVGGADTAFFDSTAGLRGRKGSVWEGGIRVPFLARWPGHIAPGGVSEHACASHDIFSTVIEASGGTPPPGVNSVSFVPTLIGRGDQRVADHLYWEFPGYGGQQAVMIGHWKGVRREMGKGNMAIELFDLANDPGETMDRAMAEPAMVNRMRVIMETDRTPSEVFPLQTIDRAPQRPKAVGPAISIPLVDLSSETSRQVVVDREAGQYLGHPTTVLLDDGRTMIAVYPKGHGAGGVIMKRSEDAGMTWSERLPVPDSWATSRETPTIFKVRDPKTKEHRLIMFSGLFPIRMASSEDEGHTWTELAPIGNFGGIVAMSSVIELTNGDLLASFHDDGRFFAAKGASRGVMTLFQARSRDGGRTWDEPVAIHAASDIHLCEGGFLRSPDGAEIALLLRENRRARNSHIMFSSDEGVTWSKPRELPGAITGDRHTAVYTPDGRLFISFRDMADGSATKGDWVAWVGTYSDLKMGNEGQCRVRLMDNKNSWDCGYPGVEVLADGTIVTTTYGHWVEGDKPFVVSVRLRLDEVDAKLNGR